MKTFLAMMVLIVAGITCFLVGKWWSQTNAEALGNQQEMKRCVELADLDKALLQTFPARSNALRSGTYLMQVWFPKLQFPPKELTIKCENGQVTIDHFNRNGDSETLNVSNNVVSWRQEVAGYELDAPYVGIIDGEEMWGRVYGWGSGDQSAGLWRIYPKPLPSPR